MSTPASGRVVKKGASGSAGCSMDISADPSLLLSDFIQENVAYLDSFRIASM